MLFLVSLCILGALYLLGFILFLTEGGTSQTALLIIISVIAIPFMIFVILLTVFCIFHIYLICKDRTTKEHVKKKTKTTLGRKKIIHRICNKQTSLIYGRYSIS